MMKMPHGVTITFLLTLAALKCESAFQELNSIDDLKRVYSEKSVPLHSLSLLHWFANTVDIDNNDVVRLHFDLRGDFGSHFYSNREGLLPSAPEGNVYYTIGNIYQVYRETCPRFQGFPEYVLFPQIIESRSTGRNRDRVLLSVQSGRVTQAYLTQHFRREDNRGSAYDPDHTFTIRTNLLRQLREFSFHDNPLSLQELRNRYDNNISDDLLQRLINQMGSENARLGLLQLIVLPVLRENQVGVCRSNRRWPRDLAVTTTKGEQNCEMQKTHVQVTTGSNGKAKIVWRGVPESQLANVAVALFRNQFDQGTCLTSQRITESTGSFGTNVKMNEGLQVRLYTTKGYWKSTLKDEICRGDEFQSPRAVSIAGYSQLQLFVRDSTACFRLYIKTDCNQWKSDLNDVWLGLYSSASDGTDNYLTLQWQWAVHLEPGLIFGEYSTFEFCTGTTIKPGLHVRCIESGQEKGRTTQWS